MSTQNEIARYRRGIEKAQAWVAEQEAADRHDAVEAGRGKIAEMQAVLDGLLMQSIDDLSASGSTVAARIRAAGYDPDDAFLGVGDRFAAELPEVRSRAYGFPFDYVSADAGPDDHDHLFLYPSAAMDLPVVQEILAKLGDICEPKHKAGWGDDRQKCWWHAVDLVTDEGWQHLLDTKQYTIDGDIEKAIVFALDGAAGYNTPADRKRGRISLRNARAVLDAIGLEEPADRSVSMLLSRSGIRISESSQGKCINAHGLGIGWAFVHGFEDGWLTRSRHGFAAPTKKLIEEQEAAWAAPAPIVVHEPVLAEADHEAKPEALGVFGPAAEWLDRQEEANAASTPATVAPSATDEPDPATRIVLEALRACNPLGAPLPFRKIVAAQLVEGKFGDGAEAELEMFDGLTARLECYHDHWDPDDWTVHWSRMEGGDIELVDGQWRRVPAGLPLVEALADPASEPPVEAKIPPPPAQEPSPYGPPTVVEFGRWNAEHAKIEVGRIADGSWRSRAEVMLKCAVYGHIDKPFGFGGGPAHASEDDAWEAAVGTIQRYLDRNGMSIPNVAQQIQEWLDGVACEHVVDRPAEAAPQVEATASERQQLESMFEEFTSMSDDLEREIEAEEAKTGCSDPFDSRYSTFAKAARNRATDLEKSIWKLKDQIAAVPA